jgi:hypothetical protein
VLLDTGTEYFLNQSSVWYVKANPRGEMEQSTGGMLAVSYKSERKQSRHWKEEELNRKNIFLF